jgi:hypothetical protein
MKKSGSLFGLISAVLFFQGCTKNETVVQQTPIGDPFQITADQYSLHSYFVDTSYIPFYEPFYQNEPSVVNVASQIVEAEVWVQRQGPVIYPADRLGIAWINLPSRPSSGYDSTFRTSPGPPGAVEYGRFYRLDPMSYRIESDGYLGVLSFYFDPVPDIIFAVAYRRADGSQYGDFLRNGFTDTTSTPMVLKMVKPSHLFRDGPLYSVAWRMLLKNIYLVYHGHVSKHEFQLDIFRSNQANIDENAIQGHSLLRVLGFDRFAEDGTSAPNGDGLFDFRPQRTIMQNSGEIIFPSLRPFDTGIKQYFIDRSLPPPDSAFLYSELYDTTQVVASQSSKNRYSIRGRGIFD